MANHCRVTSTAAIAMCDALVDLVDAGAGAGNLFIYTGTEPDYADDAGSLTEVATCALNDPAFGAAAADSGNHWAESDLDVDPAVTDSDATGNASAVTCFRIKDSSAATVLQGTLGTSGADINLNSTTIGAGAAVTITALQVRVPYNQA